MLTTYLCTYFHRLQHNMFAPSAQSTSFATMSSLLVWSHSVSSNKFREWVHWTKCVWARPRCDGESSGFFERRSNSFLSLLWSYPSEASSNGLRWTQYPTLLLGSVTRWTGSTSSANGIALITLPATRNDLCGLPFTIGWKMALDATNEGVQEIKQCE